MRNLLAFTLFAALLIAPVSAKPSDMEPRAYLGLVLNGSESEVQATATPQPAQPTATPVPAATSTPIPAAPTNTPVPPTATPIPQPTTNPYVFTGSGRGTMSFSWSGRGIVRLAHSGRSNFIVWAYDASNKRVGLLANEIGDYGGVVPLNFEGYYSDARKFDITADGAWRIEILPISSAYHMDVPGGVRGAGDMVLVLTGAAPNTVEGISSSTNENFIVWGYPLSKDDYPDLIFNVISPFSGSAQVDSSVKFLVIHATGNWQIMVR